MTRRTAAATMGFWIVLLRWSMIGEVSAQAPDVAAMAKRILDDARPSSEREAVIKASPASSAELITALIQGMEPGTKEEYRRIPWIWRVAIAAGRRNDGPEIVRVLEISLPLPGTRLDDWRVVVIGGGVINGITQAGDWPGARVESLLQGKEELEARWRRSIDLASVMADDPTVPTGTRYDALRMLGVQAWERRGAQLFRYLLKGTHPELQMGAVSALADIPSPCVAQALLSGMAHYNETNRNLALDGLLRDVPRTMTLLDAVADGRVARGHLGAARLKTLREHQAEEVRQRVATVLGKKAG